MRYCIIKNCPRSWIKITRSPEHTSFHKFPVNAELCAAWKTALGLPQSWSPGPGTLICSEHFKAQDFFPVYASGYRKLRPNVVPSLYCLPWDMAKPAVGRKRKKKVTPRVFIPSAQVKHHKPPISVPSKSFEAPQRPNEKEVNLTSAQLLNVLQSSSDEEWDSESDIEEQLQKRIEILTSKIAKTVNSVKSKGPKGKREACCDIGVIDSLEVAGKSTIFSESDRKDSACTNIITPKYPKVAQNCTSPVKYDAWLTLNLEKLLESLTDENGENIGSDIIIDSLSRIRADETSKLSDNTSVQQDDLLIAISGESDVEVGPKRECHSDADSMSSTSSKPVNYEIIDSAKGGKSQKSDIVFYRSCSQSGESDNQSEDDDEEIVLIDSDEESKTNYSTKSCQIEPKSSLTGSETDDEHRTAGDMSENSRTPSPLSLEDHSDVESSKSGHNSTQEENINSDYQIIDDRSLIAAMSKVAKLNSAFKVNRKMSQGKSDSVSLDQESVWSKDSDTKSSTVSLRVKKGLSNEQSVKDDISSVNSCPASSISQNCEILVESSSVSGCWKVSANGVKPLSEDECDDSDASLSPRSRDSCVSLSSDSSDSESVDGVHSPADLSRPKRHKSKTPHQVGRTPDAKLSESKILSNANSLPCGGDMSRTTNSVSSRPLNEPNSDSTSPPAKRPNLTAPLPVTINSSPTTSPNHKRAFENQSMTTWKVQCVDGQEVIVLDITLPGATLVA